MAKAKSKKRAKPVLEVAERRITDVDKAYIAQNLDQGATKLSKKLGLTPAQVRNFIKNIKGKPEIKAPVKNIRTKKAEARLKQEQEEKERVANPVEEAPKEVLPHPSIAKAAPPKGHAQSLFARNKERGVTIMTEAAAMATDKTGPHTQGFTPASKRYNDTPHIFKIRPNDD